MELEILRIQHTLLLSLFRSNYLDLADCSFQYHHSFIFAVVNILQGRAAQLHTSFTVPQSRFKAVSESLLSISPHRLSDQKKVFDLLNEVNTVSARISFSYVMNK